MNKVRMSKSGNNNPNIEDTTKDSKIRALKSEVNYWKTRHGLLKKYGI